MPIAHLLTFPKTVPLVLDAEDVRALCYGTKTRHSFLLKTPLPRKSKRRAGYGDIKQKFQVGQRLRVKEALREEGGGWVYQADRAPVLVKEGSAAHGAMLAWAHHFEERECLARSMPAFATRFELEVVSMSVSQLHEMTKADALAEGVPVYGSESPYPMLCRPGSKEPLTDKEEEVGYYWNRFAKRWSLATWRKNPIIEVVTFKVHRVDVAANTD